MFLLFSLAPCMLYEGERGLSSISITYPTCSAGLKTRWSSLDIAKLIHYRSGAIYTFLFVSNWAGLLAYIPALSHSNDPVLVKSLICFGTVGPY